MFAGVRCTVARNGCTSSVKIDAFSLKPTTKRVPSVSTHGWTWFAKLGRFSSWVRLVSPVRFVVSWNTAP